MRVIVESSNADEQDFCDIYECYQLRINSDNSIYLYNEDGKSAGHIDLGSFCARVLPK